MIPTLYSVNYAGFWGQHFLSLPEFITKARSLGYSSVMLMGKRPHLSTLDVSAEQASLLREHLDREGVRCPVVAAYTDFACAGAAHQMIPYLEMQLAHVESMARIGRVLGASIVRVFTAYETADVPPPALWNQVVNALQECCDRAAEHGATIAVQNHHDLAVHSDALLELLGDVDRPNCKVACDAWTMALRGEDLFETARHMAPYTACTTNTDYVPLQRFRYRPELINYVAEPAMMRAVPFGEGFIDLKAFFAGLREGGFKGPASLEMCSPARGGGSLANLDRYAKHYLDWMTANCGDS